jgi:hypothetical protein
MSFRLTCRTGPGRMIHVTAPLPVSLRRLRWRMSRAGNDASDAGTYPMLTS